ncbi:MAG: PD-(D/E)XK nuclease family protein [Acidobacteria bacterium]|nr:MAG: PD-(D/E)XK nuclease family protein [Acidobacteriota bacterium]
MRRRLLVRSSRAVRRLAAAEAWLEEWLAAGEVLVVAPLRSAADDFLRLSCPPAGGRLGVHRATLSQLAADLATPGLAADGLAPVTALGAEALAARVVSRALDAGELGYFAPVARLPGFPRALARTLRELRQAGVDGAELSATGEPGQDVARLLELYCDELRRWALVDGAGLLVRACDAVENPPHPHPLVGLPLLLLDLSPAAGREVELLRAVATRAPAIFASVPAGDGEAAAALEAVTGEAARDLDAGDAPPASRLARLRRHVFRPQEDCGPAPAADDDDRSLIFLGAPGEGRECVELARRIRQLAAEGVPFDRVAILLRDPRTYLPLVEEALSRAEIPAYFSRGTVRPHPAGRAFLALLSCAAEGLSASRFAEYLSLGQVPPLAADGAPPAVEVPWVEAEGEQLVFKSLLPDAAGVATPDPETASGDDEGGDHGDLPVPRRWEQLLVDAAVVGGGHARWARRLDGLEAELRLQLEGLEDGEQAERQRLERRLERLGHLRRFALPVIEQLEALPVEATWGLWLKALEELASRVLRSSEQVLRVLAELRPMAEVGPVGLEEVIATLEERLTLLREEPPARRFGRVFVGTPEEARGRWFRAVLLPGLAEGIFPRRASEDPLLLDEVRRRLPAGLPTQDQRVARERLLLRIAAGAAAERLVISYPSLDTLQGRARVPSFYALDVLRAANGALPADLEQLEEEAARGTASILGWPAPRQPEEAIDDAEYDLAVLEPLLRRPAEEVVSRGRYLMEANEHLKRALRRRWRRWRPTWSGADGIVDPDRATAEALARHRLRRRSYSPTALQRYAECPYRFLLYAIHRLRPRQELVPLEQLDPLTRGGLFHRVQYRLFLRLREADLLPMRRQEMARILELADGVLDGEAARARDELKPAIERVWESEIEGLRTDLHGWIRTVVDAREPWRPVHFELSFGLPDLEAHDPASRPGEAVVLDGFRLRGAIDLVESDDERGVLRVTDHKTGLPYRGQRLVVGGGEVLQPLLYALVAEELLDRPVVSGRLFYCTRRGRYESREVPVDDAGRRRIVTVLETIDHAVANGFLPAAPREKACRYCDYQLVCGPGEEQRLEAKIGGDPHRLSDRQANARRRLLPLLELRRMP